MKGHIKHKDLIRIVLEGRDAIGKNAHMQACARCRDRAEQYLRCLAPSGDSLPEPSPLVEARIMATYQKISRGSGEKTYKSMHLGKPVKMLMGGSAVAAALFLIITAMLFRSEKPSTQSLTIIPQERQILVNGTAFNEKQNLDPKINKTTIRGASLITRENSFSVSLNKGAELSISGLMKKQKKLPLIITLNNGSLTAEIQKNNDKFIFRTAHAEILVTGTRFSLSAAYNTKIFLNEGSLTVTALATGKILFLTAGNQCLVTPEGYITPGETSGPGNKTEIFYKETEREKKNPMDELKKEKHNERREIHREGRELRNQMRGERRERLDMKRSLRQRRER